MDIIKEDILRPLDDLMLKTLSILILRKPCLAMMGMQRAPGLTCLFYCEFVTDLFFRSV